MKTLDTLAKEIRDWRESKGFITSWDNMMEKLMLVVTEVSETAEAYRAIQKCQFDDREAVALFREEIADTMIRLLDICGTLNIDIEAEIERKMAINRNRPHKHGKTC